MKKILKTLLLMGVVRKGSGYIQDRLPTKKLPPRKPEPDEVEEFCLSFEEAQDE